MYEGYRAFLDMKRIGAQLALLIASSIIIFHGGGWRPHPVDWVHPFDGPACRHIRRRHRRQLPFPPPSPP